MCVYLYFLSVYLSDTMASYRRRFGWHSHPEVDIFTDRSESSAESLSQAIRAAASEEPDADGSVLFGQLQGSVVGIRYYTGVVSNPYVNKLLLYNCWTFG